MSDDGPKGTGTLDNDALAETVAPTLKEVDTANTVPVGSNDDTICNACLPNGRPVCYSL